MKRLAIVMFLCASLPAGQPVATESASHSQPPFTLDLPLRCTPGVDCWVANYIDADPGPAARDWQCGTRTYDGHDGVDFAIRDLGVMGDGVVVVASAAGKVRSVRDGMEDTGLLVPGAESALQGRECGNGVVLRHRGGWQTQYCHLRKDSVVVKPGDNVAAGTVLGAVGMSGWAEFPHLHLAVRRGGNEVDPFTRAPVGSGCEVRRTTLWKPDLAMGYEPAALYNAGFSAAPPSIDRIRAGQQRESSLDADAAALVLWVDMFGVAAGDRVRFSITAPDGSNVISQEQAIEKDQARRYMYVGKRRTTSAWRKGTYTGRVLLSRRQPGADPWVATIERQVTVR